MRLILCLSAAAALTACQQQAEAPPPAEVNVAEEDANLVAAPAEAALGAINHTSWEYTDPDINKVVTQTIDDAGAYIITAKDGTHVDHGTAVMKDGKACFTSAMDKEGESCWTDPRLEVGQSGESTSDKGEKLTLKRIAYTPLTM